MNHTKAQVSAKVGKKGKEEESLEEKDSYCFEISLKVQEKHKHIFSE